MAKGLTRRQEEILNYIQDYVRREGYPPSIREIGKEFAIGSLRGVTVHLDALERKGYIERTNTPRSIRIIHPEMRPDAHYSLLPLIGSIAAGVPITADEQVESMIPVPSAMVRNTENMFLLRVKGDSMIGDGILPRDLVVIRPQQTASQNELVAVLIGDEATVKRINFGRDMIRLMASNPAYDPIEIQEENARIVGKVVGLVRDYEGMSF